MLSFESKYVQQIDEIGTFITSVGMKIERDPTDWSEYFENDLLRGLTLLEVPDAYNPMPNCCGLFGKETVGYSMQLALAERVSRHDAGCILSLPTPSMPGHAVNVLGNDTQKHAFFSRYQDQPKRAFFAVTEPHIGSDATAGDSRISKHGDSLILEAHKMLIGGAAQGDYGLIFVRDADKGHTHKLVICDAARVKDLSITRLPMHGLVAADLTEIVADKIRISEAEILGQGVPVGLRDGFFAMNRVFERYRPVVSAQAIGNARGILDAMYRIGISTQVLEPYFIRHRVFMNRLEQIAATYMANALKQHETSRLKLDAIAFSDEVVNCAVRHIPSNELFQVPSLLKKLRDAKGYEYMEGTSDVHMMQSFPSYIAKRA